jgi:diguanylate cyclase (GGDEF)-like protein
MESSIHWEELKQKYSHALHAIIPVIIEDHKQDMQHIHEFNSYIEHYPDYSNDLSKTLHRSCDALFLQESEYRNYIETDHEKSVQVGIAFAERNYFTIDLMLQLNHSTRMSGIHRLLEVIKSIGCEGNPSPIIERYFDLTHQRQNSFFQGYIEEQNKKLKEQSIKDPLTSLYNRRHFYPYVEEKMRKAQQEGSFISLILIDFNNFKDINDELGHQEGDQVLKSFASLLYTIRENFDGAFRFGGDEFVLVIPSCREETAEEIARNLNEDIKKMHKKASISYGVIELSLFDESNIMSIDNYLNLADKRMYENKNYAKVKRN